MNTGSNINSPVVSWRIVRKRREITLECGHVLVRIISHSVPKNALCKTCTEQRRMDIMALIDGARR